MSMLTLGQRVAQAREDAGKTQEQLATVVGLDRTAISRLEKGSRKLNVTELLDIAGALGRPLSYFVAAPVSSVISRRAEKIGSHDTSGPLNAAVEDFSRNVLELLERRHLEESARKPWKLPKDHRSAESAAARARTELGEESAPIYDLQAACEQLGMYSFIMSFGIDGPDGACVEVDTGTGRAAASVINGDAPSGRRRMTLAHELGHWLFGDAYDSQAAGEAERWINSFAIHFLAPRAGVAAAWNRSDGESIRDRALRVAAEFMVSWTAAAGQLANLGLIDREQREQLVRSEPRRGDYLKLRITWRSEPRPPVLSPRYTAAVLDTYLSGAYSNERALELLHGTLTEDEFPARPEPTIDAWRGSFAGHA